MDEKENEGTNPKKGTFDQWTKYDFNERKMEEKAEIEKLRKDLLSFRARNNISLKKFSQLCNCSTQTVWNIESGRNKPSKMVAIRIRNILDNEVI